MRAVETQGVRVLRRRKLTPAQLAEINRRLEENGVLGEQFVVTSERRALRRAGRPGLAKRVRRMSLESVGEGYDVLSYTPKGNRKWIEVKATSGNSRLFEMTDNEWRTACANEDKYYVFRITNVRAKPKVSEILRHLPQLESDGRITRLATGWWIRPG